MTAKIFWLYTCTMVLYADGQQNKYLPPFSTISKNKVCYIGMPTIAILAILYFKYKSNFLNYLNPNNKKLFESNFLNYLNPNNKKLFGCIFKRSILPLELKKYIMVKWIQSLHKNDFAGIVATYPMCSDKPLNKGLLYPINLYGSHLHLQHCAENTSYNNGIPVDGTRCFFNTQCWVEKKSYREACFYIGELLLQACITFNLPQELVIDNEIVLAEGAYDNERKVDIVSDYKEHFMFDNENRYNNIIIGVFARNKQTSAIFIANIFRRDFIASISWTLYSILNGLLLTVMIHPDKNTIAYALEKPNLDNNKKQYEMHIVENVCSVSTKMPGLPYSNKVNPILVKVNESPTDYYDLVDFGIKKLTAFSGSSYLFLTLEGQLGMCWPARNEKGENIVQWSLKQHQSTFIDFEPDITKKTQSGFIYRWAFLNNEGAIFICNFLNQFNNQTTLFFVQQADIPTENETYDKIYCQDGHCGVLYKKTDSFGKDVPFTKIILYS